MKEPLTAKEAMAITVASRSTVPMRRIERNIRRNARSGSICALIQGWSDPVTVQLLIARGFSVSIGGSQTNFLISWDKYEPL